MREEEKAVVDRIEEGEHAVLLFGDDEREFIVPVEQLPHGAGPGTWLRVGVEGQGLTVRGIDQGEEDAVRQQMEDKMARFAAAGK